MGRDLLLIEPDPVVAESVRRAFTPAGFQIATLDAGEPAVDRCRASRPDLVLLSAELPDMSGFSVCNRLKRTLAGLPVILYTGDDADAAVAAHRLTRTRADEYVRTPLALESVVARAAQLIADAAEALASGTPLPAADDAPPRPARTGGPVLPPPLPLQPATVLADELLPDWPTTDAATPPPVDAGDEIAFLRERVRSKDAFLARVKEAMAAQRAEAGELRERADAARRQAAEAERARIEVERMLADARTALDDLEARRGELDRRLAESEATRQALSDVLSETMQQSEASERDWSHRLGLAEEARADVEGQLAAERRGATAAVEAEREAREAVESERDAERAETNAQLARLREERDALARELSRLQAQLDQQVAAYEEQRNASATAVTIATEERDQARRRADAIQSDLRDERSRVEHATAEIQARTSDTARLESDLAAARRRASELEGELANREALLAGAATELQAQRQAAGEDASQAERRHQAELQRQKEALIDVERRLEASARAEAQARRRIGELEKERAERTAQGERLAAIEQALARTREELEDLRTENDFLNGEVARYTQKNRDLLAQLQRP